MASGKAPARVAAPITQPPMAASASSPTPRSKMPTRVLKSTADHQRREEAERGARPRFARVATDVVDLAAPSTA